MASGSLFGYDVNKSQTWKQNCEASTWYCKEPIIFQMKLCTTVESLKID